MQMFMQYIWVVLKLWTSTAAPPLSISSMRFIVLLPCWNCGAREKAYMYKTHHFFTLSHEQTSRARMGNSKRHLICRVNRVCVRVGLCLLHNDTCGKGSEIMAVIVSERVVKHLVRNCARCIVSVLSKIGHTDSSRLPVHLGEQVDGKIAFKATILSWLPIVITNDVSRKSATLDLKG